MKAIIALGALLSCLASSCAGPDGGRLQDSPSVAERRLYGSLGDGGAPYPFSTGPSGALSKWEEDPTLKGIGRVEERSRADLPTTLHEDRLPSSLAEPWYSFPSPAPFWSEGLPGLSNTGLFGGIPPRLR